VTHRPEKPDGQIVVVQNTNSEYLGLIEDHLEGRGVGFLYRRPLAQGDRLPAETTGADGLILLGGGPFGTTSEPVLPFLEPEIDLTRLFLSRHLPVLGIGLGAQVLALAAGGTSVAHPLTFDVATARRTRDDALNGYMPNQFPLAVYMRDRPTPPADAEILAVDAEDRALVFQIGANALGFAGHPGAKSAIYEDLLMEFADAPDGFETALDAVRTRKADIEDALVALMTGIVQVCGLMRHHALTT
jgi:GMP synthase-like glutamine amidotransferase